MSVLICFGFQEKQLRIIFQKNWKNWKKKDSRLVEKRWKQTHLFSNFKWNFLLFLELQFKNYFICYSMFRSTKMYKTTDIEIKEKKLFRIIQFSFDWFSFVFFFLKVSEIDRK